MWSLGSNRLVKASKPPRVKARLVNGVGTNGWLAVPYRTIIQYARKVSPVGLDCHREI